MKTHLMFVTALACLGPLTASPQAAADTATTIVSTQKSGITLHAGVSLPVGDFASMDTVNEFGGGAAAGFTVGLKYTYPLSAYGLTLFLGADLMHHAPKKEFRDALEAAARDGGNDDVSITWFRYNAIPLSLGLQLDYPVDDNISTQLVAGLSYNFFMISDFTITVNNQTVTTEFNPAQSLGGRIGAGLIIRDRYFLTACFYGMGQFVTKATLKSGNQIETVNVKQPVRVVTLSAGVRLW